MKNYMLVLSTTRARTVTREWVQLSRGMVYSMIDTLSVQIPDHGVVLITKLPSKSYKLMSVTDLADKIIRDMEFSGMGSSTMKEVIGVVSAKLDRL